MATDWYYILDKYAPYILGGSLFYVPILLPENLNNYIQQPYLVFLEVFKWLASVALIYILEIILIILFLLIKLTNFIFKFRFKFNKHEKFILNEYLIYNKPIKIIEKDKSNYLNIFNSSLFETHYNGFASKYEIYLNRTLKKIILLNRYLLSI